MSVRRLLLENVLLLANRRVPVFEDIEAKEPSALVVVSELYGKAMQSIFKYYVEKADQRRSHALAGAFVDQR